MPVGNLRVSPEEMGRRAKDEASPLPVRKVPKSQPRTSDSSCSAVASQPPYKDDAVEAAEAASMGFKVEQGPPQHGFPSLPQ